MWSVLNLPAFQSNTPQSNLAAALPLCILIEFIDVEKALHFYELTGRQRAWNWPITPAAARLLLSRYSAMELNPTRRAEVCVLDGPMENTKNRVPPLYCIDMRWGDMFTCASRFTVRTCIEIATNTVLHNAISPTHNYRPQRLTVVHVYIDNITADGEAGVSANRGWLSQHKSRHTWDGVSVISWSLLVAGVVISLFSSFLLSLAYILVLILTGCFIYYAFGHHPRLLAESHPAPFRRSAVVVNHLNEENWNVFIGNHTIIDSLLNKPLLCAENKPIKRIYHSWYINPMILLLRILIITQWGLILAAISLPGWDALLICATILLCACVSSFRGTEQASLASWLKAKGIGVEKTSVSFSGRRALLTAMAVINPDRDNRWIDPILAPSPERTYWEHSLAELRRENIKPSGKFADAILEGVAKGSEINRWLQTQEASLREPSRVPEQMPFVLEPSPVNKAPSSTATYPPIVS